MFLIPFIMGVLAGQEMTELPRVRNVIRSIIRLLNAQLEEKNEKDDTTSEDA
jgi:hypothetical protein